MAYINMKDTDGTKGTLLKGQLGYDDYTAGGDTGRVYVGDGTTNIALAKKSELDAKLGNISDDTTPQLGGALDTNSNIVNFSKGADIVSASVLTIGSDGNYFDVTGTTTITSINTTGKVGTVFKLHFDSELILTHNATSLILPSGANITTATGDEAEFIEYASGNFRCVSYTKADGRPVVGHAWEVISDMTINNTELNEFTFEGYDEIEVVTSIIGIDNAYPSFKVGINGSSGASIWKWTRIYNDGSSALLTGLQTSASASIGMTVYPAQGYTIPVSTHLRIKNCGGGSFPHFSMDSFYYYTGTAKALSVHTNGILNTTANINYLLVDTDNATCSGTILVKGLKYA